MTRKVSCIYIMMSHMLGKCDTEIKLCVMILCFEWRFCSLAQQMSKASCITFDGSVLVENKQIKGGEVLRIQPIGSRKEFMFKFDVSNTLAYCFLVFSHSTHSQCLSLSHILLSQGFQFCFVSHISLPVAAIFQSHKDCYAVFFAHVTHIFF